MLMITGLQAKMIKDIARNAAKVETPTVFEDLGIIRFEDVINDSVDEDTLDSLIDEEFVKRYKGACDSVLVRLTMQGFEVFQSIIVLELTSP